MARAIVHVDGFNLYYGLLRGSPHKWLDLERYFKLLRDKDDLQVIHYFTAMSIPEEKPTDVNIAIQMLKDAYEDACDTGVLLSGDSDLVPAVPTEEPVHPHLGAIATSETP